MLEKLTLISVNGGYDERKMLLIGSEKCEFFHAASDLLNSLKLGYNYSILDKLELEEMQAVVAYLKENYTQNIVCPFLIYDDNKYLSGFDREIWIENIT
jgi:glutaredoxin